MAKQFVAGTMTRLEIKKEAFKPCSMHKKFNYNCHPCLVTTVGNLCSILEQTIIV